MIRKFLAWLRGDVDPSAERTVTVSFALADWNRLNALANVMNESLAKSVHDAVTEFMLPKVGEMVIREQERRA